MKSKVQFAGDKVKKTFEELELKDPELYKFILRAFKDIEENVFCGIQIPKRLIPLEYINKFNVKIYGNIIFLEHGGFFTALKERI